MIDKDVYTFNEVTGTVELQTGRGVIIYVHQSVCPFCLPNRGILLKVPVSV